MTTLEEVDRHWSIDDLLDANEVLDIKDEAEAFVVKESKRESDRALRKGRR